jgi:hypothetical protein
MGGQKKLKEFRRQDRRKKGRLEGYQKGRAEDGRAK